MGDMEEVRLVLPAEPKYGRVARIAGAHLALKRGYTLAEIDDLRLAIDEAAILLLGPNHRSGRLQVTYEVSPDDVVVDARIDADETEALTVSEVDRFETIAAELVDDYTIDPALRHLRLRKSRGQDGDS